MRGIMKRNYEKRMPRGVKQTICSDLERQVSRVATIRRRTVKMAPGGSIYALKVGQSAMARRQCAHVRNLPRLPHHHH